MTRIAFDLESNGFLDDVTTVHCICTKTSIAANNGPSVRSISTRVSTI